MKHAFLITVYKDNIQIVKLVQLLCQLYEGDIFIHIDNKSNISINDIRRYLCSTENDRTFIYKKYKVNWGSFNHLRAQLFLMRTANDRDVYRYYHLLTGQDLPLIKSQEELDGLLDGKSYIYFGVFPNEGWTRGGMSRVDKYHFLNLLNLKKKWQLSLYNKILKFQYALGLTNNRKFETWCYNSPYWSLNAREVRLILKFISRRKSFLKIFEYCYIPEEIFYSTLLNYLGQLDYLEGDSKRFEDWDEEENPGNVPAVLGLKHIPILMSNPNKCIFARKFDLSIPQSKLAYETIYNKLKYE